MSKLTPYSPITRDIESGIPVSNILQNNNEAFKNFLCLKCQSISIDAVSCGNCMNTFCKKCAKKNADPQKCSFDKCEGSLKEVSRIRRSLIDSLKVTCTNNSCTTTCTVELLTQHLKTCPFSKYKCNIPGCNYEGGIEDIEIHCPKCPFRVKVCSHCEQRLENKEMELLHEDNCKMKLILCSACNAKVPKMYIIEHNDEKCFNKTYVAAIDRELKLTKEKTKKLVQSFLSMKRGMDDEGKKKKEKSKKQKEDFGVDLPVINIKSGKHKILSLGK